MVETIWHPWRWCAQRKKHHICSFEQTECAADVPHGDEVRVTIKQDVTDKDQLDNSSEN